jgi:hypothetical protein
MCTLHFCGTATSERWGWLSAYLMQDGLTSRKGCAICHLCSQLDHFRTKEAHARRSGALGERYCMVLVSNAAKRPSPLSAGPPHTRIPPL